MSLLPYLHLVTAETKKEFIYIRNYTVENITRTLTFFLLFIAVFFATSYFGNTNNPGLPARTAAFQLIGYSFWIVALSCLDVFTVAVREDAEIGVLESLALSTYGLLLIFMSRTISRLIIDILVVSSISILVYTVTPVKINLAALPFALFVLAVTIVGLYGIGLLLAGIALLLKRVSSIQSLLNYFFLIIGGVFIPVSALPSPLPTALHCFPLTLGIQLARSALMDDTCENCAIKLLWLATLSCIYFLAGIAGFKYFENIAKKRGALASY